MKNIIELGLASDVTKGSYFFPEQLDGAGVKKLDEFGRPCRTWEGTQDILPPVQDQN